LERLFYSMNIKIYLIGFMGSGKTFLGKKLGKALNLKFVELDNEIEKYTSTSIEKFFTKFGEAEFREIESKVLHQTYSSGIIATGGGIIEKSKNCEFIRENSDLTIWLNPAWDIIEPRIINSNRPLIKRLSNISLKQLWEMRKTKYEECADLIFKGSEPDVLIKLIRDYFAKKTSSCFQELV